MTPGTKAIGGAVRAGLAIVLGLLAALATPAGAEPRHGLSTFGDLKYPPDFRHFEYVDPNAPKGGRLATIGTLAINTFDSFNLFIFKGNPAQGLPHLFDTLMVRALDEPDAMYGLVARSVDVADDRRSVTFELRPEARFSDGSPLTAEDVVFTFETLKAKGRPIYRIIYRDVARAEALTPGRVRFTFDGAETRDLPLTLASLPVLSKRYYATREFEDTSLDPPLGSGPYLIADHKPGGYVSYRRREDWWARDLAVNRGRWNFDEIRYEYFKERALGLEGLKSGALDLREEFTANDWTTAYDIPQVRDGRIVKFTMPDETPSGAQGFYLNIRRARFADVRVRQAIGLLFDFEWTNRNLFAGLYTRTTSFFENSDMKAEGLPSPAELALLEPFRARLPAEVFGQPIVPPTSDGTGMDRRLAREALRLMAAAGWTLQGGRLRDAKGEAFRIEFLITDASSERILGKYAENLKTAGFDVDLRRIDFAQREQRMKTFDYDVATARLVLGLTPSSEIRDLWTSEAAATPGSTNLSGIAEPAVDALVAKILAARSRAELVTATRALDRVLRAGHYWVPQWYKAAHHVAHWDRFGRPALKPKFDRGILDTWWFDPAKAARIGSR